MQSPSLYVSSFTSRLRWHKITLKRFHVTTGYLKKDNSDNNRLEDENAALKQEIEQMKKVGMSNYHTFNEQEIEIEQLKADNAKMRECLKWYADKHNHFEYNEMGSEVWYDDGNRARECIAKLL